MSPSSKPRARKSKNPADEIPLKRPEEAGLNIPEDEQWRLINESGVLKNAGKYRVPRPGDENAEPDSLGEEIFNALLLVTPCSFLLLMMQILIYNQYGQDVNYKRLTDKMISGVPILSIFIFYTSRYKRDYRLQRILFLMATAVGSRTVFLAKQASYLKNIEQTPPLITLWVYLIVQLDLGLAVLSLVGVGAFVWWKDLNLFH
ncbi:unnamed protein product [Mycena citricolor]|uniref:DUF7719 domain-containing protein n=1 Tax=Mycena citricolor TaxID=2018698 RepID=A0AAD2HKH7_9AGAR|nr:unnamed protein product [Mycena citricolor]